MSDEIKAPENTEAAVQPAAPEAAPEAAPVPAAAPAAAPAPHAHAPRRFGDRGRPRGDREDGEGGFSKQARFKRKSCRFCANKNLAIDYKDADLLGKFITDRGKILPRRITGNCARHQRIVARQIKRARIIAILPFVLQ
jgi:small subunit ribosomal protein S18